MIPDIGIPEELPLVCDEKKVISTDTFIGEDEWKLDYLDYADEIPEYDNSGLQAIDKVWESWLDGLSTKQLKHIATTNSLRGMPYPKDWIIVWRFILKSPKLRDAETAAKDGRGINSYAHFWCIWAEKAIEKYANEMEKEIIQMNDQGYLREEIGLYMLNKYGDEFWKPRKANTTTTPVQVVNHYFYLKMPTDIAKKELVDLAKKEYQIRKKYKWQ